MAQTGGHSLDRLMGRRGGNAQRSLAQRLPNWSLKRLREDELVIQHKDGSGLRLKPGRDDSLEARMLRRLVEDLLEE